LMQKAALVEAATDLVFKIAFKRSFGIGLLFGIALAGYRAVKMHNQMKEQEGGVDVDRSAKAVDEPQPAIPDINWWEVG